MKKLKIIQILKERGIKKKWVAEQAGLQLANFSRIINNKGNPKLGTLSKIAEVLKIDVSELFDSNDK